MENTIRIENPQVKTKINHFVKTCASSIAAEKDLNLTQQVRTAFKVLLNFIKKDSDLTTVYDAFNSVVSISAGYDLAKEIIANDFCFIANSDFEGASDKTVGYKYRVGDSVNLGSKIVRAQEQQLSWKVIAEEDGKILLFAEKSYLWEPFDANGCTLWNTSSLRKKLNSEWFLETFSSEEQEQFVPLCSEDDSAGDYLFLLTWEEIEKYVPIIEYRKDSKAAWWTASQNEFENTIRSVQRNGEPQEEGTEATKKQGVRPACWIVNPIEDSSVELEPELEVVEERLPIKIIIVEDGGHYYIAHAKHSDKINSSFLRKFYSESTIYDALEVAQQAAADIQGIYAEKYEVSIETIVLSDLMNKEFEAANQRYVVTGADGIPIVYIDQLGHKIFPVREEDIDCRLIDKVKYSAMIQQLIDEQKESINNNFDYFTIGKLTGYEVALDCDIPHIRFEIFKANSLIDGFDEFPEVRDIYTEDEKYYKGYIHALMHSIKIQKECIFEECNWSIEILDLRPQPLLTTQNELDGDLPSFGNYTIHIHNEIPSFVFDDRYRYVVVALVDKAIPWIHRDTEEALNLPKHIPLLFVNEKLQGRKSKLFQFIKTTIKSQCTLGDGDKELKVAEEWVPALANFKEFFAEDSDEDDTIQVVESSNPFFNKPAIDMRHTESEDMLSEYQFKDNLMLQSIKLPAKMKDLPEGLFYNCPSLYYVTLPDNLQTLGASIFEGCTALFKLYLPNTLKKIEDRAFYGCSRIKNIYLPEKLEHIGSEAFSGCIKLSRIFIPTSIKYIAPDAFDNCFDLKKVEAPAGCILPQKLIEQAKVNYYSDQKQALSKQEEYEAEEVGILENSLPTVENLLNNTLMLLEYQETSNSDEMYSVTNLLSKEYKND